MNKFILITGFAVLLLFTSEAQDMKRLDVHILGQATGFLHGTGNSDRAVMYAAPELQLQYNINRFFSAGIVYSRSVAAWPDIYFNDAYEVPSDQITTEFQSLGIIATAGTNRVRRLRFYVLGYATSTEFADHYALTDVEGGTFTISRTGWSYGAGFGVSVKVTRSFSINILEAKASYNPGTLSYVDEDRPYYGFNLGLGFHFLFLREK
jgi:hypothetical protein